MAVVELATLLAIVLFVGNAPLEILSQFNFNNLTSIVPSTAVAISIFGILIGIGTLIEGSR